MSILQEYQNWVLVADRKIGEPNIEKDFDKFLEIVKSDAMPSIGRSQKWIDIIKAPPPINSYVWVKTKYSIDMALVLSIKGVICYRGVAGLIKNVTHYIPIQKPAK